MVPVLSAALFNSIDTQYYGTTSFLLAVSHTGQISVGADIQTDVCIAVFIVGYRNESQACVHMIETEVSVNLI